MAEPSLAPDPGHHADLLADQATAIVVDKALAVLAILAFVAVVVVQIVSFYCARFLVRELQPPTESSRAFQLQALAAGALEIPIFGNHYMAALLAGKPDRPLEHRSEVVIQHAVRTANYFLSHDVRLSP